MEKCIQITIVGLAAALSACSTTHYRESADRESYGLIAEKSPAVPGMTEDVSVEPPEGVDLSGLPVTDTRHEFLGEASDSEVGAAVISLEKALEIAFTHSREYQSRKERLYLEALSLTLDRHQFTPIFSAGVSGEHVWSATEVPDPVARALEDFSGTPGRLLQDYSDLVAASGTLNRGVSGGADIEHERSVDGAVTAGVGLLLKGGGQIALNLTSNFFQFLTGNSRDSATTALVGSFTQPILRGAGSKVNAEFLTQAERDLLYELRSYTRFRKSFAVQVASSYYEVLRNRDTVRNNYLGLQGFLVSLERERAFQAEGLRTPAEVGRLEESKLSRDSSWINSISRYKRSLDTFRILLGVSTDASVVLDEAELTKLTEDGIRVPDIDQQEAVEVALVTRLDLYTSEDRVADADRRIYVAANQLKPDLDLIFTGAVDSKDGNRFASLDFQRSEWSAGFDLDLPLDRKAERNDYRRALIDYEVARRDFSLDQDNVKLDVRDASRNLLQAQRDYEISESSVSLNERRVEEEVLRAELGLGNIIDQVDAQNDLTNARTSRTGALVRHTVALLEFWRDIGVLYIKDDGQWEEVLDG